MRTNYVLILLVLSFPAAAIEPDPNTWLIPQEGRLSWVRDTSFLPDNGYVVQIGVYSSREAVERSANSEKLKGIKTIGVTIERDGQSRYYLVYGPYRFKDNADTVAKTLKRERGIETWVRPIETLNPRN